MALDLTSVHAKQRRAKEHMEVLKNEIRAKVNPDLCKAIKKTNVNSTRYSVFFRLVGDIPYEQFALIGGDCIHNLRSALDHLVYAIAIHESKQSPPPKDNKLKFVIADEPNDFKGFRDSISKLTTDVQTAIESVQPYKRRHSELPPLLALLHEFDIADKHKLLNVCFSAIHQGHFGSWVNLPPGQSFKLAITMEELKDGTEIAAVIFDRPTPDVTYQWEGDIVVAINHKPGPNGEKLSELYALLSLLYTEVDDVIGIVSAAV
jgi:hypothetical protein